MKERVQKFKPIKEELSTRSYSFTIWLRNLSRSKVYSSYILSVLLTLFIIFITEVNTTQTQELQADYELLWSHEEDGGSSNVSVSSNSSYIAVGAGNKVCLLNREEELIWIRDIDGRSVWDISITSDGSYIVIGTNDGKINLFNKQGKILWTQKKMLWETQDHHRIYTCVSISPDGLYIAVTVDDNREISLLNREGKLLWSYKVDDLPYNVSISSDGLYIAAVTVGKNCENNEILLFNREGKLLWSHKVDSYPYDVSISSDGLYIALGVGSYISLFNQQGKLLWNYYYENVSKWVTEKVKAVSISSDGSYIVGGMLDGKLSLYDKWGELLWSYQIDRSEEDTTDIDDVSISSDGSYIIATSRGKTHLFAPTIGAIGGIKLILDQARSVISQEKTKGFIVTKAEALFSKTEQDFGSGYYMRASKLANQAKNLALDIDQDGVINKDDFAPTIKNTYIYFILTILFLSLIFTIAYISNKRMMKRKTNKCRLIIKQLETEGCDVSALRDRLIKMKHLNQIEQEFKELEDKIQKLKQIESEIDLLGLECIVKLYSSDS